MLPIGGEEVAVLLFTVWGVPFRIEREEGEGLVAWILSAVNQREEGQVLLRFASRRPIDGEKGVAGQGVVAHVDAAIPPNREQHPA